MQIAESDAWDFFAFATSTLRSLLKHSQIYVKSRSSLIDLHKKDIVLKKSIEKNTRCKPVAREKNVLMAPSEKVA